MAELSPDTLVHQRYRIRRVIASGGMGTLYEAFDEQLERVVAMKQNGSVLPPDLFLSEAKLLARLHHPNLPAAIDVFAENDQQFFVMEFIEGRNLDQLLTERKRFSVSELSPLIIQILDALDYLHTRVPPVIHRDIKPSNLVMAQGTIYLVDFGISKDTHLTRLSGSGTRQYASPEHSAGPTTAVSDLYSLAATLYHLLTGIPVPIADVRLQEVQTKGRSDPLVPAHICEPSTGRAVSAVLSKGLSLDPHDRYQSAAEMRAAFAQAIQMMEHTAEPVDPDSTRTLLANERPARAHQWLRARPDWLWWGMVGVMGALLLCAGVWLIPGWAPALLGMGTQPTVSPTEAVVPTTPPTSPPTEEARPSPTTRPTARPTAPATEVPPTTAPTAPLAEAPPPLPEAPPNTIRIALQSPATGEWGALGTGIRNGAELASEQRNGPLARLGFNVQFVPFDDKGNEEQGKVNAEAIVADPAVLCVVGHFNSGVTLATQPIYESANLAQISPGSTNPAVTDDTTNVWRVVGRDDVQGVVAAQFAREELNSQRAYIIHDNTQYGRGIAQFFRQDAEANGGPEVVNVTSFDDTQAEVDFTPFLEEIQGMNPDVIFFAGSYTRGGGFFKQVRERGINAQFLGGDSLDNAELATLGGEAVNGMHFTTVAAPVSAFQQAAQFAQDYRARYEQDAPPFSPESYDAAAICIEATARAARASGRFPTREQVLEAMRALPRYEGISGNYTFNPNGDPLKVGYFVVQVNVQNYGANEVVRTIFAAPPN